MGFVATPNGTLYLFGGYGSSGEEKPCAVKDLEPCVKPRTFVDCALYLLSGSFDCVKPTGTLNDLYSFSPFTASWSALSPSGLPPPQTCCFGNIASTPDGTVYVFASSGNARLCT